MPDTFPAPMRLSTASDSRGGGAILGLFGSRILPITATLPIAERVRASLLHACEGGVPAQISGKDAHGRPRRGHDHLYILPFASTEDSAAECCIDRVLLWARAGLEDSTRSVLERISKRGGWVKMRGEPLLRLELLAMGPRAALAGSAPDRLLGSARVWRSITSFVPPRFPKRRRGQEIDAPEDQLSRLSATILGCAPIEITSARAPSGYWNRFCQRRLKDSRAPHRPASGWVLRFSAPVMGPVVLGHGAHYGLGRFEVSDES